MPLDVDAIRSDFPILSRKVSGGKDLVYLDNAATTQKPQSVIDAMTSYYEQSNANVHRAVHTLAAEATEMYENARNTLADWFGTTRDNLIFTSGTTEAINLVAWGWARSNLKSGDAVIITEMEHHADIVPWQLLAEEKGIEIRVIPINTEKDILDMDIFEASLPGAKLVCVVHTSNVLGVANPIPEIINMAKDAGSKVLIDAAQAAPHHRLNFSNLGADFVAISGHKMCGPTGIGCLLATSECIEQMEPFMSGGDMIETVTMEKSTFASGPQKFEAGTPKIAEAIGFAAAAEYLSKLDMDEVHHHIRGLAKLTAEKIKSVQGITVYGDHSVDEGSGVVSFLHDSIHAEDLARFMDAGGFAMRTGHHCAQPLLDAYGVSSTNRVSFYLYNTEDEANAFVDHLRYVVEKFGG
ncbi:MAG: cysteine desulfurase [Euryarchaeota archaeon]|nr:cysteine desulfurase [Euryarchaeota archaeon]MEC7704094.1 SufS family cysteine desulfurase [Candidatus Thermoplasmatota archaeon]MED5486526.1 SufS family cysteine desulfurase [Candidatus Thermoplasmatota archaeon]